MMRNKVLFSFCILIIAAIAGSAWLVNGRTVQGADEVPAAEAAAAPEKTSEYWGKRCNKDDATYCEVFQSVSVKATNQKLLEVAIGFPKDRQGAAEGVIVLPLGFIMTDGIGIQVDEGEINKAMVRFCNSSGCFVYMNLPEAFIASMEKGKELSVFFLDGTGKKVRIKMPLTGFESILKEIKT